MNYFFGFSLWKHNFIKPFFCDLDEKTTIFINPFLKKNYFNLALKKGLSKNSSIYIWGKKSFPLIEEFASKHNIKIYRVEDGFIRSIGLGSDLTQPYSVVVDSKGIYFDPTKESDLEYILKTVTFDDNLLKRAQEIQKYLIEKKLSKYNLYENKKLNVQTDKKIALVVGQVEDDASIQYGASGMTNLELLKLARENTDNTYIVYKPHPDVLVGNRVGHIAEKEALKYADRVVTEVGLESVLEVCDEVHTMTSLVGFEALMRKKRVFSYGMPFYAGWGLTKDKQSLSRRDRDLSLDELVAATLIVYPKYIDPIRLEICEIEQLLEGMEKEREVYNSSLKYRTKIKFHNFITRKLQLLLRIITLKS
ncbi:MAG: capsule biosynthesis protein [Campylobacterota bacterium]|nr:capsule biosynthesis protein [Campylobacterota bacterium]